MGGDGVAVLAARLMNIADSLKRVGVPDALLTPRTCRGGLKAQGVQFGIVVATNIDFCIAYAQQSRERVGLVLAELSFK